jgi:hypothetical protein
LLESWVTMVARMHAGWSWVGLVSCAAVLACSGPGDGEENAGTGGSAANGTGGSAATGAGAAGVGGGAGLPNGGAGGSAGEAGGPPITFGVEGWSPSSSATPHFFVQPDDLFRVHPTRPRLYFRQEDVDWIKQRGQGPLAAQWKQLRWMADSMMQSGAASSTATGDVKGWFGEKGQAVAFLAYIEQDAARTKWAVDWAKALGVGSVPSDDTPRRARLQRMAVVYDWLYDAMTDADRAEIRGYLVKYLEAMAGMKYIQDPGYLGGHERWGYAVVAMGSIALHGDWDGAEALLTQTRQHLTEGFFPTQAWVAHDGGYHMGWAYTAAYTDFDKPYLVWTVGTNDVLLDDWMAQTAYWNLYGMRGNDTFPEAGDAYSRNLDLGFVNTLYAAGIGKLGHAKWLLDEKLTPNGEAFLQILTVDPSLAATPPTDLPLGRLFDRAGLVVARDAWDGGTTHFTFKSSAFYSTNHHHRDENAFTIHYQTGLALDSGVYDSYSSTHWDNYYARTIAHNAIVVHDPAQTMQLFGQTVSNDGGQVFKSEARRLDDVLPGGPASLAGVVSFENRDAFTYALGDATAAYDPARVTLAQRDVVYLRDTPRAHPVIVVYDRVGATQASFKKTFLLHTVAKPTLSGKLAVAINGAGRLSSLSLYPTNATLTLVGGPGKEYWVDGTNYPPTTTQFEPGAWRLEVSPATGSKTDQLLHVLFVDDAGATPVSQTEAVLVEGDSAVGGAVAGWVVVFPKAPGKVASLAYSLGSTGKAKHLVTGLTPGASVSFLVNGAKQGEASVGPGGCAVLELTASAGATVTVSSS